MSWSKPVKNTFNGKWYHENNVVGLQCIAFVGGTIFGSFIYAMFVL